MRRHVGLEVSWIPKFAHQLTKSLHQEEHDVSWWPADSSVVFLLQEVVSQRWDIGKSLRRRGKYETYGIISKNLSLRTNKVNSDSYSYLQHHVGIVIGFDIVETYNAWQVCCSIIGTVQFTLLVKPCNVLLGESWLQYILCKKK